MFASDASASDNDDLPNLKKTDDCVQCDLSDAANSWAGLSVGANVSYVDVGSAVSFPIPGLRADLKGQEEGVGISLEYMTVINPNVLGGFEVMLSKNFGQAEDNATYRGVNINRSKWDVGAERSIRLLGKLAFAPSEASLFYFGAGIENIHMKFRETTTGGWDAGAVYDHSDTMKGHVVVAGFDHSLSNKLSLRFEVSHTSLDKQLYEGVFSGPTWIDPDVQAIRVGLRYNF